MARDKTRMSRDITKDGPEKHTVSRAEMHHAGVLMVAAGIERNATYFDMAVVLDVLGYNDWEMLSD